VQTLQSAVLILILAAGAGPPRTWTDSTGNFSVEAELVEVREGNVQLRKADGSTVTVPVTRLSDRDRRYLVSLKVPHDRAKGPAATPENSERRPPKPKLPDAANKARAAMPRTAAAALSSPTRLAFVRTPLKDVVDHLKNLHHVEI
jgi:hypothetical protein